MRLTGFAIANREYREIGTRCSVDISRQDLRNRGGRFSLYAATPSFASSVP